MPDDEEERQRQRQQRHEIAAASASAAAAAAAGAAERVASGSGSSADEIGRLQLNLSTYTVDGDALPAHHPDRHDVVAGAADARAALQHIPADHPEAPQQLLLLEQQQQLEQQPEQQQLHEQQQQHHHQQQQRAGPGAPQQQQQQQQRARRAKQQRKLEATFAVGDLVWGEVVHSGGAGGARVRLLGHDGAVGFMPATSGPADTSAAALAPGAGAQQRGGHHRHHRHHHHGRRHHHQQHGEPQDFEPLPLGHVRAFKIVAIPDDMTHNGRGPLVSAADADADLLWARAEQAFELASEAQAPFSVTVARANGGGLLAPFLGLAGFIPFSALDKARDEQCVSLLSTLAFSLRPSCHPPLGARAPLESAERLSPCLPAFPSLHLILL